jgi:anti-anti-sigma factor
MEISPIGERVVRVTIAGRLDTPGVDRIETRFLASLVPGANSAIVNLSDVEFIASMGIRMLVSAARGLKLRNGSLALYGAQAQVTQVLEMVALQQIIAVCSTEAEALAAIGSPVP